MRSYIISLAVLAMSLAMPLNVLGQDADNVEHFTLTNGYMYWSDGTAEQTARTNPNYKDYQTRIAYDRANSWKRLYPSEDQNQVTIITERGTVYMALNIPEADSTHPTLVPRTTADFDPKCVWARTGSTGYYYQEWGSYRYYLVGSKDRLRVSVIRKGKSIDDVTLWYDWDFGAAITDVTFRRGDRTESYYWVLYDTIGKSDTPLEGNWGMSCNTYYRPDDAIYSGFTGSLGHPSEGDLVNRTYYCPREASDGAGGTKVIPYGTPALYLPVGVEVNDRQLGAMPEGKGLTGLASVNRSTGDPDNTLAWGDTLVLTAIADLRDGGNPLTVDVMQPYTMYTEEVYRRGMHLMYNEREEEGYGHSGLADIDTFYYWSDDPADPSVPYTKHLVKPAAVPEELVPVDTLYSISGAVRRFARLSGNTLYAIDVPTGGDIEVTVTIRFSNGMQVDKVFTIHSTSYMPISPMPEPTHAPVIHGYVVGGGRMANVGGGTMITVHSCDSIYAIYGGNDIAGWVQGTDGAQIKVGTDFTNATRQVRIGYLYGGGCGYYTYQGINTGVDAEGDPVHPYADGHPSLIYQSYYFNGYVYPWTYLPANPENPASWDPAMRVVPTEFSYNPVIGNPSHVDQTEQGEGGNGTIPYITTAHITVGVNGLTDVDGDGDTDDDDHELACSMNDNIHIDSLFGGAENSFIGIESGLWYRPANGVTIDVYGGIIMALFGGNNYGGSVAKTSTVFVNVHDTKIAPKDGDPGFDALAAVYDGYTGYGIENTYFHGYGRDFGIRHVFGGGNLVEGSSANVTISGGMVDTCFIGGNRASVTNNPIGTIDCRGDHFIFENPYLDILGTGEGQIDVTQPEISQEVWNRFKNQNPGSFNTDVGRYNVRAFFGGNNNAPMYNMSTINLNSGGVSYVWAGGNAGDMRNTTPIRDRHYKHWLHDEHRDDPESTPEEIAAKEAALGPKVFDMEDSLYAGFAHWEYGVPTVLGSLVHSYPPSRIIVESVYGGCRMANVKHSSVAWLSGGVFGYVQGGNDVSGDVGSETGEGTYAVLDRNAIVLQDAYGGSDGYYHCTNPKDGRYEIVEGEFIGDYNDEAYDPFNEYIGLLSPTHNSTNLYVNGATVLFSAYGGGVKCNVGFEQDRKDRNRIYFYDSIFADGSHERGINLPKPAGATDGAKRGSVHFQLRNATIGSAKWHRNSPTFDRAAYAALGEGDSAYNDGNAYGGGYLSAIYGLSYFCINGNSTRVYGSVYAGNDCIGSIQHFGKYEIPELRHTLKDSLMHEAHPAATFAASDGTLLNPTEANANASYSAYLRITDKPHISCVYGSGNGAYDYDGTRPEYSSMEPVCQGNNPDNRPFQSSTFIDIHTSGGYIDTVFGGGNGVGVRENVMVLLNTETVSNPDYPEHGRFVGTIFGGNNRDEMKSCVPDIVLKQGTVKNVYGGGNAGGMEGSKIIPDICNNDVIDVSAYITFESDKVTVTDTVFGGCRMADVRGMTYIRVLNTTKGGANTGIRNLYGGNDISGHIKGNTRIDISGGEVHNIFGGSNGRYDYDLVSGDILNGTWDIYKFQSVHNAANLVATGTTGEPFVDSTMVNLYGGTLTTNVYGGSSMSPCRATNVVVNDLICEDEAGDLVLEINGNVFGGGEGYHEDLSLPHRGNVELPEHHEDGATSATYVHLHHADILSTATAYGGGYGGDVESSNITVYNTWDIPFDNIYGGCWGSDVKGTAYLTIDGKADGKTASNVFGGNDFTGNVYRSVTLIENGTFDNVYGAGNGNYDEAEYTAAPYTTVAKRRYVPNNERTELTINNGTVNGNVYGGGKLGTVMAYRRNAQGEYILDANDRYIPDTAMTAATAYDDPEDYAYSIVNINGGNYLNSVYAGAAGAPGGRWLTYGLKMLNINDGTVNNEVYGGSENVSDGYINECDSTGYYKKYQINPATGKIWGQTAFTGTTMRPSSVVNIAGGVIKNNVYGGGYLGSLYGSAYVNIGIDAIDSCVAWAHNGADSSYWKFKPGVVVDGSSVRVPAPSVHELQLQSSVYSGSNWGDNGGNADFSAPGVFGGETRIVINGEHYNTYMDEEHNSLPLMNIGHSIIGAGTSASGGDVYSRIKIRNYGAISEASCKPTRSIRAIQRAEALYLENTAIDYTGSTDAISAYLSQQFTINRVDTLNCIGYNIVDIDASMTNIGRVNFLYTKDYSNYLLETYDGWDPAPARDENWFEPGLEYMYVLKGQVVIADECSNSPTLCDQLHMLNRDLNEYSLTAFVVNNGINVDLISTEGVYSDIYGYGMLIAENGTNAVVTASAKYGETRANNGGFVATCKHNMKAIDASSGTVLTWCDCFDEHGNYLDNDGNVAAAAENYNTHCYKSDLDWNNDIAEYEYHNYGEIYRVWSIGEGVRRRYTVIQAHSKPERLENNKKITLPQDIDGNGNLNASDKRYDLSLAKATLVLPPTTPGNYYRITVAGISIDDENQEMRMADVSYLPNSWDGLEDDWFIGNVSKEAAYVANNLSEGDTNYEPDANGTIIKTPDSRKSLTDIHNNPGATFGLLMYSGANFGKWTAAEVASDPANANMNDSCRAQDVGNLKLPRSGGSGYTVLSGNSYVNVADNFATAKVGAAVNASPELDLYMVYDNRFNHTLLGTVTFTLDEYVDSALRDNEHYLCKEVNGELVRIVNTSSSTDPYQCTLLPGEDTVWTPFSTQAPIEVEISISTILHDFSNMEYELLAMYNEGRHNTFSRRAVLPATLQHRELYLQGIEWAPTKGDGSGEWMDEIGEDPAPTLPTYFMLTDDTTYIRSDASDNNLFGITIQPTDNISNTHVSERGWHTRTDKEYDLYSLSGKAANTSAAVSKGSHYWTGEHTFDELGDTIRTYDATRNPQGIRLGELDGRGEAALTINLNYNGNKVYNRMVGAANGSYVGRLVMTLASYTGGDYENPNIFHITLKVKTRVKGDTVYVASANTWTNAAGTTYTGRNAGSDLGSDQSELGKRPMYYVTSLVDAFDDNIYEEGDVICVLDTVIIPPDQNFLIKGNEFNPVPILRYCGTHPDAPGEANVYRGTMIKVSGPTSKFSARCIDFNGGMFSKILGVTKTTEPTDIYDEVYDVTYTVPEHPDAFLDTNRAFGPIIAIMDGGEVELQHGTQLHYNYNGYDKLPGDDGYKASNKGTISITGGGKLKLKNDVTITENLSQTIAGDTKVHPLNGAIFVDGGTLELMESATGTRVLVINNYGFTPGAGNTFWKAGTVKVNSVDKKVRLDFDADDLTYRSNVLLTRTAGTPDADMNDDQSDVIVFSEALPAGTRIGVSKWFPDDLEAKRDTIKIAFQDEATHLNEALLNGNFVSDTNYFIFYNYGINNQYLYLQRCATFRYQMKGQPLPLAALPAPAVHAIAADTVLSYRPLKGATCPTGDDTIIYRIQGGFPPYTYTWTGHSEQSRTTRYSGTETDKLLAKHLHADSVIYLQQLSDTLITSHISMHYADAEMPINYTVTATDATGANCALKKNIEVTLKKDQVSNVIFEKTKVDTYDTCWVSSTNNAWNFTESVGDTARAIRRYKAIAITPYIWSDRTTGVIVAKQIIGSPGYSFKDTVYVLDGADTTTFNEMLFCEGDVLKIATSPHMVDDQPKGQFIMWDFDPYYSNPATYIVPAQSTDIIAYYGPRGGDYWTQAVNTTAKAGASLDENIHYSTRPTPAGNSYTSTDGSHKAGYVTTYQGDVHIYDENGLAWFISVVNGINNTQAREFYFNNVYLHKKADGSDYDMQAHLWTPVGTQQHPFRGYFLGVDNSSDSCTVLLTDENYVTIKNIIVNEPDMAYTGFFGHIDSARIASIKIEGALVRGSQYVAGLAAESKNGNIKHCAVSDDNEASNATTILTTHYVSGGVVGKSTDDKIDVSLSKAKYVGDAVFSGGVVGYGTRTDIQNSVGYVFGSNNRRMSGLYLGGIAGYLDGTAPYSGGLFRAKRPGQPSHVVNNYVRFNGRGSSERIGGIVGYAENTIIENNYVYGSLTSTTASGAVTAVASTGTAATDNYYESGSAKQASASLRNGATMGNTPAFSGKAHDVSLSQPSHGVTNLTRALNRWVRSQDDASLLTWRSDLDDENNGYPVFGQPEMFYVNDTLSVHGCDSIEWDGQLYSNGDSLTVHIVDSLDMLDSTTVLHFYMGHSSYEHHVDTGHVGQPYTGHGFYLSPAETELLSQTLDSAGEATITLVDSLTTASGCDSIITLTITFFGRSDNVETITEVTENAIRVYPNPTTSNVTVETAGLQHVELYDNEGRTLADYMAREGSKLTIDINHLSSGIYYLRIHAADKVTIQKIIKR